MDPWKRKKALFGAPKYVCTLRDSEREVLGSLASMVAEALIERAQSAPKDELAELTGMPSGHKEAPTDPALARLLPDFERPGDEEYEGDNALLRSLHETEITKAKLEGLTTITFALGPGGSNEIVLTEQEAHLWLRALNDIRLYLDACHIPDAVAKLDCGSIADWVGGQQEMLLDALMQDFE